MKGVGGARRERQPPLGIKVPYGTGALWVGGSGTGLVKGWVGELKGVGGARRERSSTAPHGIKAQYWSLGYS